MCIAQPDRYFEAMFTMFQVWVGAKFYTVLKGYEAVNEWIAWFFLEAFVWTAGIALMTTFKSYVVNAFMVTWDENKSSIQIDREGTTFEIVERQVDELHLLRKMLKLPPEDYLRQMKSLLESEEGLDVASTEPYYAGVK